MVFITVHNLWGLSWLLRSFLRMLGEKMSNSPGSTSVYIKMTIVKFLPKRKLLGLKFDQMLGIKVEVF